MPGVWKSPKALAWILPLVVCWVLFLPYVILYVFLGVPLKDIVAPGLAFAAATLAMSLGVYWAALYRVQTGSGTPFRLIWLAYGLVVFSLWVHYALSLGIGHPRTIVSGAWIGAGMWCLGVILAEFRHP
jgi:hypothetical protein